MYKICNMVKILEIRDFFTLVNNYLIVKRNLSTMEGTKHNPSRGRGAKESASKE